MKGRNQFLLKMRGSFENVTVTGARDGDVIVKGKIVDTSNPNTVAQSAVRTRFRRSLEVGRTILAFLNLYFFPSRSTWSSINAFLHYNLARQPRLVDGEQLTDYEVEDLYTYGRLYNPSFALDGANSSDNGNGTYAVAIDWNYDAGSQIQDGTDVAKLFLLNQTTLDWKEVDAAATRADGTFTVNVDIPAEGTVLIVPFMANAAGTDATKSVPVATLTSAGVLAAV
ncbi:MAG: hypothetical protein KDD02_09745 [Phaeodactylibacter sp.]|nr:hypothetical protein [Phaeodactylibacter sp.]MCB9302608.1 hypothetical protein [Lewinellaceae bacterium]